MKQACAGGRQDARIVEMDSTATAGSGRTLQEGLNDQSGNAQGGQDTERR